MHEEMEVLKKINKLKNLLTNHKKYDIIHT